MNNVTATASVGIYSDNRGVYNSESSSPEMNNVTAEVSGGTAAGTKAVSDHGVGGYFWN